MSIRHLLSSAQDRRDMLPNKELAKMIVQSRNATAVSELETLLVTQDDQLLFDVLKTLQIIGEEAPEMIAHLYPKLAFVLGHKTNKVVWMGMCVMSNISYLHPEITYQLLPTIMERMNAGGAIMKDKGFSIMLSLYLGSQYQEDLNVLMLEQLRLAPDNQFGQYIEKWMACVLPAHTAGLVAVTEERIAELSDPMHKKRSIKVLKKIQRK